MSWREQRCRDRISHSLIQGIDAYIEDDTAEIFDELGSAIDVIEGPLMDGMNRVGDLFGEEKDVPAPSGQIRSGDEALWRGLTRTLKLALKQSLKRLSYLRPSKVMSTISARYRRCRP